MRRIINYMLFLLLTITSVSAQNGLDRSEFASPPRTFNVRSWWHWMDGNITKEGITKDLEAMNRQGITQVSIISVGKNYSREVDMQRVKFNSPEWIEMFRWALHEAERLDITVGIQTIDGYCTTGGPWITPELSMKQYAWSKTVVKGGQKIEMELHQPVKVEDYYVDVAVVAFPLDDELNSFRSANPRTELNKTAVGQLLCDANPQTEVKLKKGDVIDVAFGSPTTVDKLALLPHLSFCWDDMAKVSVRFALQKSDDGKNYTKVADLDYTGMNEMLCESFPVTTARYFRLEFQRTNFKYFSIYPVAELELLRADETPSFSPALTSFFEKTASVFDVSENVLDPNRNGSVAAVSEDRVLDITAYMSADGKLKWNAPKGNWQIIRFGYTSTGVTNDPASAEGHGLEADKMDTTAINVHMDSYAKKLIAAAEEHRGKTLKFVLLDSWEAQFQTWSKDFPMQFERIAGYDITPWLPALCGETIGSLELTEAFLHDFRKTIAHLIDINYYKHFSDLCHRNDMEIHGEVIYSNWGAYPPFDPLRANKYMDIPMTEFWAEQDANNFAAYKPADKPKQSFPTASALAHDKQIIGSEAYTSFAHFTEAPYDLKPFGDASYCSGVNQLVLHSFVHQPFDRKPGMTLGKFGAHFNRNNPAFEYCVDWFKYQSRVQYVLQKGMPVVDVAFYAGDELPQFFSRSFVHELPYGYQATVCNIDMLRDRACVEEGKISFGGSSRFHLLMLPNSTKMELSTLRHIERLVDQGAVVYGPRPTEMLSVNDIKNNAAEFTRLTDKLWGGAGDKSVAWGCSIAELLQRIDLKPDFTTDAADPLEVMFTHRRVGDTDIYYLFNQQNRSIDREIVFRVSGKTPQVWNPENGEVCLPSVYSTEGGQTRLPVTLKPFESKIVVFQNIPPAEFICKVSSDGKTLFPRLSEAQIPPPTAVYDNGKFIFTAQHSADYTFTTSRGRVIEKRLMQPRHLTIDTRGTKIDFSPISDERIESIVVDTLRSLTEFDNTSIKYFAGDAKYTIRFAAPKEFTAKGGKTVLSLGEVSATAKVMLNGKLLGYAWQPQTTFDVSTLLESKNILEISVATICRNRFIGDLREFGAIRSLWTTSPVEDILSKDMPLKPSGLMGELRLIRYE